MTIKPNVQAIQDLLKEHPDGLTIIEMSEMTGINVNSLHNATKWMDDVYVDRWAPNKGGTHWVMVFCRLKKPPIPPRPLVTPAQYQKQVMA